MKQGEILISSSEKDYELLDSGAGEKLERFGSFVLSRPDPQALWARKLPAGAWAKADGVFVRKGEKGSWSLKAGMPLKWRISLGGLKFWIEPTPFKHVGLFPEQKSNWEWVKEKVTKRREVGPLMSEGLSQGAKATEKERGPSTGRRDPRAQGSDLEPIEILNLFGYTGGATLAALSAGASVTHVDGSKSSIKRAKENAELSGLADKPVRWMLDDARDFVKREIRRGKRYDGIIMDPPSFGRGDKGQVWKIENDFVSLFNDCLQLLSDRPIFFLINGYAAGYSPIAYANNLDALKKRFGGTIEAGELAITENKGRLLPCGIFARWSR